MDKDTIEDYQYAQAGLQTFMLRLDAIRQASEDDEAEFKKLSEACDKLLSAVGMLQDAWHIISNEKD